MGIRETLNKTPALVIGFVVIAVGFAVWVGMSQSSTARPMTATDAYYTIDDGKSWYVDKADLIPPVSHEGKEAVRLMMFTCGDKEIPGYVERFTPEAKAFLEKAKTAGPNTPPPGDAMGIVMNGKEVKKIGETKWVKEGNRAVSLSITQVKCGDGQMARIVNLR